MTTSNTIKRLVVTLPMAAEMFSVSQKKFNECLRPFLPELPIGDKGVYFRVKDLEELEEKLAKGEKLCQQKRPPKTRQKESAYAAKYGTWTHGYSAFISPDQPALRAMTRQEKS